MTLSKKEQQAIITKIRKSKTFKKTSTSSSLLQYLFDSTLKGTNLKEGVIDMDFFGELGNSEKSSPRVRVSIYNLRKKLISYYENEGKEDTYRLVIEKGQYETTFVKQKSLQKSGYRLKLKDGITYFTLIVLSVILLIKVLPEPKPKTWKNIFKNNLQTTLYVGDSFGFMGLTPNERIGWIRDYEINNHEQFIELKETHPNLNLANYNYVTGMAVLSTQKLQSFFQTHDKNFNIRFTTKSSVSEIKEGNAIYVGPIKNENQFVYFFNQSNPYFKIEKDLLTISNHPVIKDTVVNLYTLGQSSEYAIVSKIPGPNQSEQMLFFSNHDIGVSSTVEFFTNKDSLSSFENLYLKDDEFFTAIFQAKGKNRTNIDLKLLMAAGF